MRPYDIYVFFLCFVVFTALTALFSFLIYEIVKLTIRLIKHGVEDEKILEESKKPVKSATKKTIGKILSIILCIVLIALLSFSLWLHFSENSYSSQLSLKVVASSSMAKKHKNNAYLFEHNLDNQLNVFDLIVTHEPPKEFDLQLYDVIVYEYDNEYIIHRIVAIEEPNEKHPNTRLFFTQGDAVSSRDREPVEYSQIKAIYNGERVQFVGSFVFFMRSPAGWLCVLLIIFAIVSTPICEKKINQATLERLAEIKKSSDNTEKEG